MFDPLRSTRIMVVVTFVSLPLAGLVAACGDSPATGPERVRPADEPVASAQLGVDTPSPRSAVTIETAIDFSSPPFNGTFEVTQGADALGCERGTFVDRPSGTISKTFTCDVGRSGTFTARFKPFPGNAPYGWWAITEGTDGFATLHGSGKFQVEIVSFDPPAGVETLTGAIHYAP